MTQALADRINLPDALVASGPVIDLRFRPGRKALSLRAGKVFHLCVKNAGARLTDDIAHTMRLADLYEVCHLNAEEMVDTVSELVATIIEMTIEGPLGPRHLTGGFLSHVERDEERSGEFVYRFSETMRRAMRHSDHWAVLSKRAVLAFESRYSLRLYELISLRKGLFFKSEETFPLGDLKNRLGVPKGKLAKWDHFKSRALEPAIAEVNHLSGFTVRYEMVKEGRFVNAVRLKWAEKTAGERKAASKELSGHSAGRKARRAGTVETIADGAEAAGRASLPPAEAFPASGSIRYTAWADIARRSHPAPLPDLERLTEAFRQWCASRPKPIPLNSSTIRKVFETWCAQGRPAK